MLPPYLKSKYSQRKNFFFNWKDGERPITGSAVYMTVYVMFSFTNLDKLIKLNDLTDKPFHCKFAIQYSLKSYGFRFQCPMS